MVEIFRFVKNYASFLRLFLNNGGPRFLRDLARIRLLKTLLVCNMDHLRLLDSRFPHINLFIRRFPFIVYIINLVIGRDSIAWEPLSLLPSTRIQRWREKTHRTYRLHYISFCWGAFVGVCVCVPMPMCFKSVWIGSKDGGGGEKQYNILIKFWRRSEQKRCWTNPAGNLRPCSRGWQQ